MFRISAQRIASAAGRQTAARSMASDATAAAQPANASTTMVAFKQAPPPAVIARINIQNILSAFAAGFIVTEVAAYFVLRDVDALRDELAHDVPSAPSGAASAGTSKVGKQAAALWERLYVDDEDELAKPAAAAAAVAAEGARAGARAATATDAVTAADDLPAKLRSSAITNWNGALADLQEVILSIPAKLDSLLGGEDDEA